MPHNVYYVKCNVAQNPTFPAPQEHADTIWYVAPPILGQDWVSRLLLPEYLPIRVQRHKIAV